MNKYIKQFMDDHDLKVGEKFKRKGDTTDAFFHFDENRNLVHRENEITKKLLMKFLLGEYEVEKVKKGPWKPKLNEKYWFVSHYGDVYHNHNNNDACDKYVFTHCPIFQTDEEAKDYKWFLDKVDEYKKPFELHKDNYRLYYNYQNETIGHIYTDNCLSQGAIYFGDKNKLESFIKEVGEDRIKKYWFNIWG